MPKQQQQEDMMRCKGTRHHDWVLTDVKRASSFGIPTWHLCQRCTAVRVTIVGRYDNSGKVLARYYKHPDGYKQIEITADEWRMREIKSFRAASRQAQKVRT